MQEYIFGDLLKTLRKAKRLSQQALADKLGVHRNTIWNWEQGVYLPDSKGMVLELARQLGLDESETKQLLEASLTTVSSWNVPFARNPFFSGREQVLYQLQAALSQESSQAAFTQSYALHSLGGIGKTQVAVEYAYQHRAEYEAVLWVEAETPIMLVSSFAALADLLAQPERVEEKDQSKIVTVMLRWLSRHQGRLLIFDNVEDLAQLKPFLPTSGQGGEEELRNKCALHRHCHDQRHAQRVYGTHDQGQITEEPDDTNVPRPVLKPSGEGNPFA